MTGKSAPDGQYITLKETSVLTGAAYATLRREIDNGRLTAYKVGRKYFIPRQQAENYARQRRENAAIDGYTIRQLMNILPLSYAYIIDLIRSGKLQAVKQGRYYLIPKASLEAFLEKTRLPAKL